MIFNKPRTFLQKKFKFLSSVGNFIANSCISTLQPKTASLQLLVSKDWLHDSMIRYFCGLGSAQKRYPPDNAEIMQHTQFENAECNMGHQKRVGINYGTECALPHENGRRRKNRCVSKSFYAKLLLYSRSRTQPRAPESRANIHCKWMKGKMHLYSATGIMRASKHFFLLFSSGCFVQKQ